MPQCISITRQGHQCTRNAIDGSDRCTQHQTQQQRIVQVNEQRQLGKLANDTQNVHTTLIVKRTIESVNSILNIERPDEYKNIHPRKDIFCEIILECPFTILSLRQFTDRYWSIAYEDDVYGLGPEIYQRVTDSIWYYIKQSPHKEDLCKRFAEELRDSVGMCAQGNLSRLCNVLGGYLDTIKEQRTINEIIGDKLSAISKNTTLSKFRRLQMAKQVFEEVDLPREEWIVWLEPLIDDIYYLEAWMLSLD
jgi:hypothetical protein